MNFYTIGKNYLLGYEKIDFDILLSNENNIVDFLRGYVEINSELIKPNQFKFNTTDELIFNIYFTENDIELANLIKNKINIFSEIIKKKI